MARLTALTALTTRFAVLRWRLLQGSLRGTGSERMGVIASTTVSAFIGVVGGLGLAIGGRDVADPALLFVVVTVGTVALAVALGVVTGVSQPVDPRVIATEPLSGRARAVGLLAATASGPPGLAGAAIGAGLAVAAARGAWSVPIVLTAVAVWLGVLLLAARTATNVLGLLLTRFPRAGQLAIGLGGLGLYVALQAGPTAIVGLDRAGRDRLTQVLSWNPVGQLGRALASADAAAPTALAHLALGATVLPVLAVAHVVTSDRLAASTRIDGAARPRRVDGRLRRTARRLCGGGGEGAVAWRDLLIRFRTPRTTIETVLGASIGLAAVLAPVLFRDDAGGGAVLVGGAVQLAVLFMSGNVFGSAGPALTGELLAGAEPGVIVRGTARSIAIAAAPVAVLGPLLAAAVTGRWEYLPAGLLVAAGSLLAGTGGAVVQSAFVPIAMPESDNPFAHGESGRGLISALLLLAVIGALAVLTLPVFLALFWATTTGSVPWVTILGLVTIGIGRMVMRGGIALASEHIRRRGPEFVRAITPAR
ncbi:MAG: hypothetical protein WD225_00745 [Ilumatobacteraceae bacterium]